MTKQISGNAWVYGDNIDTDLLTPGAYMKSSLAEMASHCLEAIDPSFAKNVNTGDILVAGEAFGIGSSREQAAQALVELGISAVLAKSFARIFYRNALNLGLPVLVCESIDSIEKGDKIEIDPIKGLVINHTKGEQFSCEPIPEALMKIVNIGGLMPALEEKFNRNSK